MECTTMKHYKNKHAARKKKLFKRSPLCHWCGKTTIMPPKGRSVQQHDFATLDHLDSRLSGERGKHPGMERTVLACFACNNRRAQSEQSAMSKDYLRLFGGSYPAEKEDIIKYNTKLRMHNMYLGSLLWDLGFDVIGACQPKSVVPDMSPIETVEQECCVGTT